MCCLLAKFAEPLASANLDESHSSSKDVSASDRTRSVCEECALLLHEVNCFLSFVNTQMVISHRTRSYLVTSDDD